jgi:hypothetical protein
LGGLGLISGLLGCRFVVVLRSSDRKRKGHVYH